MFSPGQLKTKSFTDVYIAEYQRRHPLFLNLKGDWEAQFHTHWQVQPLPDTEILMRFDDGSPLLLERDSGLGKVLMTSSLDVEWNNLPLQGEYLPLLHEMLRYLALNKKTQTRYHVGDSFSFDVAAMGLPEQPVVVRTGEGQSLTLKTMSDLSRLDDVINRPGFVEFESGTRNLVVAVNNVPEESDFTPISGDLIHDKIINRETGPSQSVAVEEAFFIEQLEKSQHLWRYLIVFLMLLIVAETLLANRTFR